MAISMMFVVCMVFVGGCALTTAPHAMRQSKEDTMRIIDFALPNETKPWFPLNDGVMGGVSQSELVPVTGGTAVFRGNVSFENNGGFATVQTNFAQPLNLSSYRGMVVRIKGDTKRYGMYLRTSSRTLVYQATFETSGEWQTIEMPFDQFAPTYFGRTVPGEPLDTTQIRALSLLIEYKQEGPFALEVAYIGVY